MPFTPPHQKDKPTLTIKFFVSVVSCSFAIAFLLCGCAKVEEMAQNVSDKVKSDFDKAKEELNEAAKPGGGKSAKTDQSENVNPPQAGGDSTGTSAKPKTTAELLAQFKATEPGRIDDNIIVKLANDPNAAKMITEFKLSGPELTEKALKALSKFPNLSRLTMARLKCLVGNMQHIGQLKTLRFLDVEYNDLIDSDFSHIRDLTGLEEINFGDTKISDAGFNCFSKMTNLAVMRLNKVPNLDGTGFRFVPKASLRQIYAESTMIGQSAFDSKILGGQASLELLFLNRAAVGVDAMKGIGKCTGLKELHLQRNSLQDNGIVFLEKLKNLESLSLKGNPHVTNLSFKPLSKIKGLKYLNVMDTGCTSKYEKEFLKRVPNCKIDY